MSGGVYILSNEPNVHSCYVTTKNEYKFVNIQGTLLRIQPGQPGGIFLKIEGNGLMDLPIWMGWGGLDFWIG